MQTVSQLLEAKPTNIVHTIGQGRSILEAAERMNLHRIGALIVTDTLGHIAGIITERDILTRVVTQQLDAATTPVSKAMTTEVIHCTPQTTLTEARHLMSDCKIRHIPVIANDLENKNLVGMISIGDLNAATNADLNIEVKSMRQYIAHG